MAQSILYYPTINIEDSTWLRDAALYWDEVCSIVPYDDYTDMSAELMYMQERGQYRPIYPQELFRSHDATELYAQLRGNLDWQSKKGMILSHSRLHVAKLPPKEHKRVFEPDLAALLHYRKLPEAQRNLNFNENIALKSYSQAEDFVFWGTDEKIRMGNKECRWEWGKYTTKLMDDFENVLAALIALKNNENDDFVSACKIAEKANTVNPQTPVTSIDKLQSIWNEVFPQRELLIDDSKFFAVFDKNGEPQKYSANQMSDGERSVLYLAAQVLCVPENKTMIIDEPEIHLHRSIMNRLWMSLEKLRTDCLFIYITHDTQFVAMHTSTDKIWIREYDGENWKLEKIPNSNLPEELLLDILGARNNVIFVEGEKNSYDTQLYTALYPAYHIIPCGSCSQVIERTKAFRRNQTLHNCTVYGIIDMDYRCVYEIEKYKEDNIFALSVAEVENLFITEELIRLMANHMGKNEDEVFTKVKEYVIRTRFENQIEKQICQSVVAQIKYMLASAEISKRTEADAKNSLNCALAGINYDKIKTEEETRFQSALSSQNYANVIRVFNEKGIAKSIGQYLGIDNSTYCATVVALLHGNMAQKISAELLPYLPVEIPR